MRDHALDDALLAAHETGDILLLASLYKRAADMAFAEQNIDAACFYLTHAYVFGLQSDAPETAEIHRILVSYGREM